MQDLDIDQITDAVIAQMATTPDPRLREIMEAAVRHLHAFAREVRLTPDEWLKGIAFLTAVGQMCSPVRQEFILLSDVLGLSRLVNVMHDAEGREAAGTETSLLGPFFREAAPRIALGEALPKRTDAPEILLYGQVRDAQGRPVPHATIDVWQTDADGLYDLQAHDPSVMDNRGQLQCDEEGRYYFRTVKPLGYSIPMDGPVGELVRQQKRHGFRPAHIHLLITAPGYRDLVTALYFADDPHVDSDTVFGVSRSLIVQERTDLPDSPIPGMPAVRYDFTLSRQGAGGSGRVGADPTRLASATS
ncbi:MAG: dioxygenase [Rhodovarius sp.]|nr:hydroxyquinol 1,2-dioxygenase [Rhodovarius sp.]MCX7932343.1 hydroxyquinol 1,2-dioxygenase [Rhodovarius sp.]MDW8314964.1 dioxygenase [Rhodovarius sp.]